MNELDFSGKTVLVTGSSRGIGAAMVRAFAAHKCNTIVNYVADPDGRNESEARQVASEIGAKVIVQCNVADREQVARMMSEIQERAGGVDILVNNAGILKDRTIKKMAAADWDDVLKINLTGAFNVTQGALPLIRSGGRIINISSVNAVLGFFGSANYASSKAGLIALTKVTAREVARQQITANAVAPGFINTEMTQGMPEDVTKQFIAQIPLGRFGNPDEVVNAVLFLASPLANYITGQVLHVNGGFFMD
jgi:3-oxoacyl-[acyl-carrier protein] reductase